MLATKEKILKNCEQLFFEYGIANTRLQQIADASEISVGNLAYHFKNKDAIVIALYEKLFSELSQILSNYILHKELDGFDKQFSSLFNFYKHNNFTFNNHWEIARNYPDIQHEWLGVMSKVSIQLKKRIDYNIKCGNVKPEEWKGAYDHLTDNLSLLIHSWIPKRMLQNKLVTESLYKKALWSLLIPILTQKGKQYLSQSIIPDLF